MENGALPMMDAKTLARLALARIPKPYKEQVVLHVFCEIERTPHLRGIYDNLSVIGEQPYDPGGLNQQISIAVKATLKAETTGQLVLPDQNICQLVGSVALLGRITQDWEWD